MAPTISVYTAERHRPNPFLGALPGLLALAGVATIAGLTSGTAWLVALLWLGAAVVFTWVWRRLARRGARVALVAVAIVAAVLLTWEGGLLLIPALLALLAIDHG
jgi:hypothetical protein